jgi:hypothetical protein
MSLFYWFSTDSCVDDKEENFSFVASACLLNVLVFLRTNFKQVDSLMFVPCIITRIRSTNNMH